MTFGHLGTYLQKVNFNKLEIGKIEKIWLEKVVSYSESDCFETKILANNFIKRITCGKIADLTKILV